MSKVEAMLVAVLIVIALLLGILFGGSSVWFLKPEGKDQVVEKTVNKYVCSDGTTKDSKDECPIISEADGESQVVCPPCNKTDFIYRKCDCDQCKIQCGLSDDGGAAVTTTTLHVPKCDPCTADSDCGQPEYSEFKCSSNGMYRIESTPICDDSCCKVKQEQKIIRKCTDQERCVPGEGCVVDDTDYDEE
ncbi:MAG: hypothetical protein GF416_07905 [Candidatus Altiarchaeales archaeon]|nr:hypothetical protein [Candidatus Altiarchaeales archaeon]MBD3417037.1 hypothetical protein [Candidatus Altiarchaeales archaeon]